MVVSRGRHGGRPGFLSWELPWFVGARRVEETCACRLRRAVRPGCGWASDETPEGIAEVAGVSKWGEFLRLVRRRA